MTKKNRIRFSIRFLLVLTVVVSAVATTLYEYRRELEVATQIQAAGGAVIWHGRRDEWTPGKVSQRVEAVYFTGAKTLKARHVALIAQLDNPKHVGLASTPTCDRCLELLADARTLVELDLSGTKVTDAGVGQLVGLRRLRELKLYDTDVSYEAIVELCDKLPRLDGQELAARIAIRKCHRLGVTFLADSRGAVHVRVDDPKCVEDVREHAVWIPDVVRVYSREEEDPPFASIRIHDD